MILAFLRAPGSVRFVGDERIAAEEDNRTLRHRYHMKGRCASIVKTAVCLRLSLKEMHFCFAFEY
jgi:hypothetical protein